jgi:hypothetical protein
MIQKKRSYGATARADLEVTVMNVEQLGCQSLRLPEHLSGELSEIFTGIQKRYYKMLLIEKYLKIQSDLKKEKIWIF